MNTGKQLSSLFIGLVILAQSPVASIARDSAGPHRAAVAAAFERWSAGTGSPFELLAESASWTILGPTPSAGTYSLRRLREEILTPFQAQLETPLTPVIRSIHEDGETVIVLFEASARLRSGARYENSYAWFLEFEGHEVRRVTAVLDLSAFDQVLAAPAVDSRR